MKVPDVLGGCTLLEFNVIDSKNGTTSQTKIEVAGAICGPARYLAICSDEDNNGFCLFFCNENWVEWNDMWFEEKIDAKDYAEEEYPKSSHFWELHS